MPTLQLIVPLEWHEKSVRAIALGFLKMSHHQLKQAKFNGSITLNDSPVHVDVKAKEGQELVIFWPEKENTLPDAADVSLTIPYEDEYLLIIDKPAPLPTASSSRQSGHTLENAVFFHLGCPDPFVYRPVNRLDKGTSGLLVVAKDAYAQSLLQKQLHGDDFIREYLAVTDGIPKEKEGIISAPIGKANGATIRREVREDGQEAATSYRVLETSGNRSLVYLHLYTGRTHQIRVHLSSIGCPVTGDFLYGQEIPQLPGRFALHSTFLRLRHPITGQWLEFESALPEQLRLLL